MKRNKDQQQRINQLSLSIIDAVGNYRDKNGESAFISEIVSSLLGAAQTINSLRSDEPANQNLCKLLDREKFIQFADWLATNQYKRKYGHPKYRGYWWSDYDENGYLDDDQLFKEFQKSIQK